MAASREIESLAKAFSVSHCALPPPKTNATRALTNQIMDPALYMAAIEGTGVSWRNEDRLAHQLTPRSNTVLHVASQFQDNGECVKEMLIREPSLLRQVNSKGETALHIAARRGCSVTVKELLAFAKNRADPESDAAVTKELLRMATLEKNTALHEAVRNNHHDVVKLLLEEDPDLSYAAANSAGETPLYLAAERHHHNIVKEILRGTCWNQAYDGPNGRTALHAAVIANCSDCVEILLRKDQDLIKIGDSKGWMPLHFAVRLNLVKLTEQLLETDESIAYLTATDKDEEMTALHLAAKWGLFDMMDLFWLHCPDCWEMVNNKGQNVLHIAIKNENENLTKYLLKSFPVISSLLNEKDEDGNTPLHLLATSDCNIPELIRHHATDKGAFNRKNQTPKDIMMSEDAYVNKVYVKELIKVNAPPGWRNTDSDDKDGTRKLNSIVKENIELMDKNSGKNYDNATLVATLIATVTFAASFTVPGGFDGNQGPNQGLAVLVRNAAFKAFVISNTIALTLSISALHFLFSVSAYMSLGSFRPIKMVPRNFIAMICLNASMMAMMVSLVTGSFAVLSTSMGLAVAVCTIVCVGFLIHWVSYYKMYRDIMARLYIKVHKDPRYAWVASKVVY